MAICYFLSLATIIKIGSVCINSTHTLSNLMRRDPKRSEEGLEDQMSVQQHERALQRVQAAGGHCGGHGAGVHLRRRNYWLLALWLLLVHDRVRL